MNQAYTEGKAAFLNGEYESACPYKFDFAGSRRQYWLNGYNDAMKGCA